MDFRLTKEQQLLLLGLIASIVVGLAVMLVRPLFFDQQPQQMLIEQPQAAPALLVHICGAVKREGVFKLKPGDRILDALTLAGGALPTADLSGLNLAEPVKDGQKIIVPAKLTVIVQSNTAVGARINLNTADEKALDSLPGIGATTAKQIVDYRRTNGPFIKPEQIMELPRFGKSKFERIKGMITI